MNDIEDVISYVIEVSNKIHTIKEELTIIDEIMDDIISFLKGIEED